MSGPKDRDVMAEAAGRRAVDVLEYIERHTLAERERIFGEVMARIDRDSKEPLDAMWSVQKWLEVHAAEAFGARMRKLVAKGEAASKRNAEFHPNIG